MKKQWNGNFFIRNFSRMMAKEIPPLLLDRT